MAGNLPWPIVRFGAASELIGRPVKDSVPFTSALGIQLIEAVRVVLGSDLESVGLQTRIDPVADPGVLARMEASIAKVSGAPAAAWWHKYSDATTLFEVTVMFLARGVTYSLAYETTGWHDVLDTVGLPETVVSALRKRLGPLAESIDRVMYDQIDGAHRVRFDAISTDPKAIAAVLDASRIPAAQRDYYLSTAPVWTLNEKRMAVRVATRDSGPLDQIGVSFKDVSGENMMRAWKTFRPRPQFAERLGAFVAAMGTEVADLFELRFYRTGEPHLEATFTPLDTPFSRPIRA